MKPPILSDEEIENEVDALCQSLLLHPMNLPTIKKIAIESIKGLIGEKLEEAKAEVAREIFEEIRKVDNHQIGERWDRFELCRQKALTLESKYTGEQK